jgi:hypothetical protein
MINALTLFSSAEDCFGLREKVIGGLLCMSRHSRFNHLVFNYRQRQAVSPAFSNAAIRRLTPTFYDTAYKVSVILPLQM